MLQVSSKVHIISHSMGNRVTSETLLRHKHDVRSSLGQLIFAAIDINDGVFSQGLADLSTLGAFHQYLPCHSYVTLWHMRMI